MAVDRAVGRMTVDGAVRVRVVSVVVMMPVRGVVVAVPRIAVTRMAVRVVGVPVMGEGGGGEGALGMVMQEAVGTIHGGYREGGGECLPLTLHVLPYGIVGT
jgi:hypothetical protein